MTKTGLDERTQEIRDIHTRYKFVYQIIGGMALVLLGVLIGAELFRNDRGYGTNLYTEVLSIAVTIFILDRLAQRREEKRELQREREKVEQAREQEKQRLIRDLGSEVNNVARKAAEELDAKGWLRDGSLQGVFLGSANLREARLWNANLQKANLIFANLREANLALANLRGANLGNANLHRVVLRSANLQGAKLWSANLKEANLQSANLHGAKFGIAELQKIGLDLHLENLRRANLEGADLTDANLETVDLTNADFDQHTILPNGDKWNSDTDLRRFTDPAHLNFWRSPAYPGKGEE